ncbi:hypothetical protein RND71_022586 [Anisodus tanguticus]|uniref:Uncharacterized protein n=1 Tax=Anisodus tanguticus TaxID=243964 RepID=A0AAE1RTY3_9SOLA|nr:hypothetical protein RND71_022586 [Anisodus tanguticus]
MGCFLGCFGFTTKKQKRIKPCNKFQVHQKYVPLDSEKANAADSPNSEPRDKPKESSKRKVKKKVSFNLDVKTYERIQDDDDNTTYSEEEEKKAQWEYNEQETAKSKNKFGNVEKLNKDEPNEVGRNHRNSVLLPVENLTQWKAVKARQAQEVKHQKENIIKLDGKQELPNHCVDLNTKNNTKIKRQGHEISVDASLSNWLVISAKAASVKGPAVCYIKDSAKDQVVLDKVNII